MKVFFTAIDFICGVFGVFIMYIMDVGILRPQGIIPNGWIFAISGAIGGIVLSKFYSWIMEVAVEEKE